MGREDKPDSLGIQDRLVPRAPQGNKGPPDPSETLVNKAPSVR
jgi:hypothetical protein